MPSLLIFHTLVMNFGWVGLQRRQRILVLSVLERHLLNDCWHHIYKPLDVCDSTRCPFCKRFRYFSTSLSLTRFIRKTLTKICWIDPANKYICWASSIREHEIIVVCSLLTSSQCYPTYFESNSIQFSDVIYAVNRRWYLLCHMSTVFLIKETPKIR